MTALRALFLLATACGAALVWLAPHPPMIDLPQHAGQLALLKQLLTGDARWSPLFQINPVTPYFIGFGLALPLTWLMSVAAAMKLLLSLAYLAFVAVCVALRKQVGGDARVDWLFLTSFFGFAFHWGFFTFLTAAPLGLLLILQATRQAETPTPARGAAVAALGVLLLVSHGLVFLFAMLTSGLVLLTGGGWRAGQRASLWTPVWTRLHTLWPLVLPGLALLAYYVARGRAEAAFMTPPTVPAMMGHWGLRHEVFSWAQGLRPSLGLATATAGLLAAPWLLGLRIQWRQPAALMPFAVVALVLSFAPSFVFETSFVYERFALFLLPSYAWLFAAVPAGSRLLPGTGTGTGTASRVRGSFRQGAVLALLGALTGGMLAVDGWRIWQFGRESADFDAVTAKMAPGQRVLALIHDTHSVAADNFGAYVHHASWYQAEQQGLVDFNFAWVQPQIVRYRVASRPPVALDFPWRPDAFSWQRHGGAHYRYFLVRHAGTPPADLFADAACKPRLLHEKGRWQVYERSTCPQPPTNVGGPANADSNSPR